MQIKLFILVVSLFLAGCGGGNSAEVPTPNNQVPAGEAQQPPELPMQIMVAGNSWIKDNIAASDTLITEDGLRNWQFSTDELVTYVYLGQAGALDIALVAHVTDGASTLAVSVGNETKQLSLSNAEMAEQYVGEFYVDHSGYQAITIRGLDKSATTFANIDAIKIGGAATNGTVHYVKDDFYWGRRGPSVHLNFTVPDPAQDYQWFYTELEVPSGQDTLGSYFMANGFAEGYMGIQVNSATERRVLFSVWSPYQTDDPSSIPDEYKIELLKKGPDVYTGEFGNEGAGGQSYLVHQWQADMRYRFLLEVKPSVNATEKTDYTAYFYSPELAQWQLIASFRRPKTSTYVTRPHSFLENFIPASGQFERKAIYDNQWLRTYDGQWHELTQAEFSYDATARKNARLDYQGGVNDKGFFLRNTGFFSENTAFGTKFERNAGIEPVIDMNNLPQ